MSRRTRAFVLGLAILAVPLLLVLLNPLLNPTPDAEAAVEQTVAARLTDIASGTPTAALEERVEATLTAIALPTPTPRSGAEGAADQISGFVSSSPVLACCAALLLVVGALYMYSVARYGK
jgi:hypothetical protein